MINPLRAFRLAVLSLPSTGRDESGDGVGLARLVIPYIRDIPRPFSLSLHLSLISRSPVPFVPFQEPSFGYVGLVFVPRHSNIPDIYPVVVGYTSQLTYRFNIGTTRDCSISRRVYAFDKRHRKALEKSSAVKGPRGRGAYCRFDDPPCTCPVHGDKYLTGVNGNTRSRGHRR